MFTAHSTRGASSSAAADTGITASDILKAADWNSESVFMNRSSITGLLIIHYMAELYYPKVLVRPKFLTSLLIAVSYACIYF